jgi:hypothetical protein
VVINVLLAQSSMRLQRHGYIVRRRFQLPPGACKELTMLRVLSMSPDAVFLNASGMITMEDPVRLEQELTALAVKDGRIIALGPDAELTRMAAGAEVVDAA